MICLQRPDLVARGIKYTHEHIARLVKQGKFPPPFQLTPGGRLVWDEAVINAWLEQRAKAAHTPVAAVPVPTQRRPLNPPVKSKQYVRAPRKPRSTSLPEPTPTQRRRL
jgi:prophage regulatory protein